MTHDNLVPLEQNGGTSNICMNERYFTKLPLFFVLTGLFFIVLVLCVFVFTGAPGYGDFFYFYSAASLASTPNIESASALQHAAGTLLHSKLSHGAFPYLPGFVYLYWVIAHLPIELAYRMQCVIFMVMTIVCARLLAAQLQLQIALATLLTFAWMPTVFSIALGQNTLFGFTLALLSWSYSEQQPLLCGVMAGLLCYKPIYALPVMTLLLARRQWRSLLGVALTAVAWYGASALATGGNALWPFAYIHLLASYAQADLQYNSHVFIGLSNILGRIGLPTVVITLVWSCIAGWFVWLLPRVSNRQAWSLALAMSTALSPHALIYDAVFTLPALLLLLTPKQPLRFNPIWIAYAIVFAGIGMHALPISPAFIVTLSVPMALLVILTHELSSEAPSIVR